MVRERALRSRSGEWVADGQPAGGRFRLGLVVLSCCAAEFAGGRGSGASSCGRWVEAGNWDCVCGEQTGMAVKMKEEG